MLSDQLPEEAKWLELTPEKVQFLWKKLSEVKGLHDDFTRGQFPMFLRMLSMPNSLWLERKDGNGILYMTEVIQHLSATAHFVYWDKRLRGREEFTMDCLRFVMEKLDLMKVNAYLPQYAAAALHFVKKLEFKKEGTIRRWSYSDGKLFDIHVFGITREEAFNGRLHESLDERGSVQLDGGDADPDGGLVKDPAGNTAAQAK